jgi:thiosulfate dehydrogenase (quinone) large subunit
MTTATSERGAISPQVETIPAAPTASTAPTSADKVFAALRITLGLVFLWAFVDKLFGLGFATASEAAWVNGGSPTFGFLTFGTAGPLAGFYQGIAGAAWADWLFMIALLGLGVALTLGIGLRVAAVAGTVLMAMMFAAALPPENHPFLTYHVIYALAMIGFALADNGRVWGLGGVWQDTALVRRVPALA